MNPTGITMLIESVPSWSHPFLVAPEGGDQDFNTTHWPLGTLYSIKPHVSQWVLSLICPMGANLQMGTHGVSIHVARIAQVLLCSWMMTLSWWVNSRVWAVVWTGPRKTPIHISTPLPYTSSLCKVYSSVCCLWGWSHLLYLRSWLKSQEARKKKTVPK